MAKSYRRIRPVPDPPVEGSLADRFVLYEAIAWASILSGLAVLIGIILGLRFIWTNVLPSMTDSHPATLTAAVGTVEVREQGSPRWTVATSGVELSEGDAIRTNQGSHALITFFDLSTATLYPGTQVTIGQMRSNKFHFSAPRSAISVSESSGRALFGVAHLNPVTQASFSVHSGSAVADFSEGSYVAKVMPDHTFEVVATRGSGFVHGPHGSVTVDGGERTLVPPNGTPQQPILAAEDLIQNGDFSQITPDGKLAQWTIIETPAELNDVPGKVMPATDGTQPVVAFSRTRSTYHAEGHLVQSVNQDVTDYNVVRLELRFKITAQSVSGGGEQGSEYPLMVRVNYLDQNGSPAFFVRGFYIQNDQKLPTTNGMAVPRDTWVTLAGEQGIQLQNLAPQPQFIQSIDVQASGHDYASELQKIALIVE